MLQIGSEWIPANVSSLFCKIGIPAELFLQIFSATTRVWFLNLQFASHSLGRPEGKRELVLENRKEVKEKVERSRVFAWRLGRNEETKAHLGQKLDVGCKRGAGFEWEVWEVCGQSCVVRRKEIGVRKHNSGFLSPTFFHPKCNLYDLRHKF